MHMHNANSEKGLLQVCIIRICNSLSFELLVCIARSEPLVCNLRDLIITCNMPLFPSLDSPFSSRTKSLRS
eukprot:jgi/Botrbrau1/11282/Bobra.0038s0048.1